MNTIGVVLLVFFVIVCVLLVLLVAIQDDGENGMGGLLGGRGTAAFGSHSASVLTKTTGVLVALFFILAFGLALVNKPKKTDVKNLTATEAVEAAAETEAAEAPATNWYDDVAADTEAAE